MVDRSSRGSDALKPRHCIGIVGCAPIRERAIGRHLGPGVQEARRHAVVGALDRLGQPVGLDASHDADRKPFQDERFGPRAAIDRYRRGRPGFEELGAVGSAVGIAPQVAEPCRKLVAPQEDPFRIAGHDVGQRFDRGVRHDDLRRNEGTLEDRIGRLLRHGFALLDGRLALLGPLGEHCLGLRGLRVVYALAFGVAGAPLVLDRIEQSARGHQGRRLAGRRGADRRVPQDQRLMPCRMDFGQDTGCRNCSNCRNQALHDVVDGRAGRLCGILRPRAPCRRQHLRRKWRNRAARALEQGFIDLAPGDRCRRCGRWLPWLSPGWA